MTVRSIDITVAVLLIIGGLNWGLVGFFGFNMIGALFGGAIDIERIIYAFIGLSGIYEIFQWRVAQCRVCPPATAH